MVELDVSTKPAGPVSLQSGLKRLKPLGLIDWTNEAAVIKFADRVLAKCKTMRGTAPRAGPAQEQGPVGWFRRGRTFRAKA
jgi:hypothetical protein